MGPISKPNGAPFHAVERDVISNEIPDALAEWQAKMEAAMQREHDHQGRHVALRHPKACVYIIRPDTNDSVHGASVVGTQRVLDNLALVRYTFDGVTSNYLHGTVTFPGGFPGTYATLDSSTWNYSVQPGIIEQEREVTVSGLNVLIRVPWQSSMPSIGLVIY